MEMNYYLNNFGSSFIVTAYHESVEDYNEALELVCFCDCNYWDTFFMIPEQMN